MRNKWCCFLARHESKTRYRNWWLKKIPNGFCTGFITSMRSSWLNIQPWLSMFTFDMQQLSISDWKEKRIMVNGQGYRTMHWRVHRMNTFEVMSGIVSRVCKIICKVYVRSAAWFLGSCHPSLDTRVRRSAAGPQSCSYQREFSRIRATKRITSWLGNHFVQHICSQMAFISHFSCATERQNAAGSLSCDQPPV